jgi:hypothetical protein
MTYSSSFVYDLSALLCSVFLTHTEHSSHVSGFVSKQDPLPGGGGVYLKRVRQVHELYSGDPP